jgi:hypothetical protein
VDSSAITSSLPPIAAIVVSLATFVFTQIRAQRVDDRAAAKTTVQLLLTQIEALLSEVDDLRRHQTRMEQQHNDCERERLVLLQKLVDLQHGTTGEIDRKAT